MSYSEQRLRDWMVVNLERYGFRREEHKPIFLACTPAAKRKKRFGANELATLKLLITRYRPERSNKDRERYAASDMITKAELADEIDISIGAVRRAMEKINAIAKNCRDGRKLILFNSRGVGINVGLFDALSARSFSEKQASSQIDAHADNIDLANKNQAEALDRDRLGKFKALTPEEQAVLLSLASGS